MSYDVKRLSKNEVHKNASLSINIKQQFSEIPECTADEKWKCIVEALIAIRENTMLRTQVEGRISDFS